jgi:hypothetical protein
MAKSVAACFQLVHRPPVSPRKPWRSFTPAQMKSTISHSPAMLMTYSRACPCGSACVPPPAPGADILFTRVPHQSKPAWIRRKITVWYQGAIRRRGLTPGAETEDTMRPSVLARLEPMGSLRRPRQLFTPRTYNLRTKRTCIVGSRHARKPARHSPVQRRPRPASAGSIAADGSWSATRLPLENENRDK